MTCRDQYVLPLLVFLVGSSNVETWTESGTAKKCYPVQEIASKLGTKVIHNILGFHSLTGCDTTSSFCGISKKTCWKRYVECLELEVVGRDGSVEGSRKVSVLTVRVFRWSS